MTTEKQKPSYENIVFPEGDSQKCESPEKCAYGNRKKAALEEAHKIRQFEIRLYWQRSLYFWGFQAAFFAAYAFIFGNSMSSFDSAGENKFLVYATMMVISALGFYVSLLWCFLAKGSKAWQENWENHIDQLEERFTGHLYKTVLGKSEEFYSVTKINQFIIRAIILTWLWLFILPGIYLYELYASCGLPAFIDRSAVFLIIGLVLTIIMCVWKISKIKSSFPNDDEHYTGAKIKQNTKVKVYFRWNGGKKRKGGFWRGVRRYCFFWL